MSAWSRLSLRTQQSLTVFFWTTVITFLFCLTPYYRTAEARFFDIRLKVYERFTDLTDQVVFVTVRDTTLESGFTDRDLLQMLHQFQANGVEHVVLVGTNVFQDYLANASMLPENVTVINPSDAVGAKTLFQGESLHDELDPDGILRHLSAEHEAVKFWNDFELGWHLEPGQDVYLLNYDVSHHETGAADLESLNDIPAEVLKDHVENVRARVVLVERIQSSATRAVKITTPSGELTAGQIHMLVVQTLMKDWTLTKIGWIGSAFAYLILVGGFVLALGGRKPGAVAAISVLTLVGVSSGCLLLLPLELDIRVILLLTGLFVATVLLLLFGLRRSRRFLEQFGGAEDAGFSGQESRATMVFTNLPKFLMEMERNHDQDLLKYRREYNEVLAVIAGRYHGKVLDYQGDAQMLGFGLRYDDDPEHAAEATSAGLEIVEEVAKLADRWNAPAEQLKVSVGVCTGSIALGHLGAVQKQDIAAIGDTTNTAARLMGAAMKQGVGVLVSKPTYIQAEGTITGTELPPVELKGKSKPVEVFHATSVDSRWQEANRAKNKDVVPTGGTLDYSGRGQESLIITVSLAIIGIWIAMSVRTDKLLEAPEVHLADRMHKTLGFQDADPSIVLVGIDEPSVNDPALGGFPWSRGVYAQAVDNLRKTKCRGVFVDVLFKKARPTDPRGDRFLARMVEAEPRLVLAGTLVRDQRNRLDKPQFLPAVDEKLMMERAQIGLIHNLQDSDGVTRSGYLCVTETASHDSVEAELRSVFPSAAVALLLDKRENLELGLDRVRINDKVVQARTDDSGRAVLSIRFGPAATAEGVEAQEGSYPVVSFRRLLDPNDPIFQELDGKFILIGQTRRDGEANFVDRVNTISGNIKGVEVHARILDSLLNDSYIKPVSSATTQLLIVGMGFLTLFILARYREPADYLSRMALVFLITGVGYVISFVLFNVLFEILILWFCGAVVAASILMGRHVFTFRALTRVIPAEVAEELLFRRQARDRRQIATILLTDIRGYTTLSEGKTAVAMLDVLNEYHKRTVACYDRYGGQALTYQGDAQIVVFGVFGNRPNPAADAAAAALGLQSICDDLREEWGIESREDFDVGAGLCTGEVEVGLLGGGNNLQYSVVGETVRKAHKVQSLSDELSAPVIMDEETYQATKGAVEVDDLGMVQPKGLPHEIRLYRARSVK